MNIFLKLPVGFSTGNLFVDDFSDSLD